MNARFLILDLGSRIVRAARSRRGNIRESSIQNQKSKIAAFNAGDAVTLPIDRSVTALTKGLVQEDEVIILLLRPSLLYVVLSSLGGLVLIAMVTFALAYMAKFMSGQPAIGWSDRQAFGLGLGLTALRLGWQFLEWLSRVYILTDRRIICRSGVLRVFVFETQLKNIQHTSIFANVRERLFGLGTIGFATAGSASFEAFWVMIRKPYAVHKIVLDAVRRYGR